MVLQYLKGFKSSSFTPPLCSRAHVLEFLKYLDQLRRNRSPLIHPQSGRRFAGGPMCWNS
ncbi:hypothetical protein KSP40_PGU006829 [Platanthera guangdongensis]|uniref:Uncharacterized protein n=1 Tax=Platanthera guangdongensis TaxID=2320717 RepID=A0ABR2LCH7_9ASPA